MTKVQTITGPDGSELVVLPKPEFERLVAAAEDRADMAAAARAEAQLAAGEDELVPQEIADRLLAGHNPVRVWRYHRGLTQMALARAAGVNQSVISDIESNRRAGTLQTHRAIAKALGLTLNDLEPVT